MATEKDVELVFNEIRKSLDDTKDTYWKAGCLAGIMMFSANIASKLDPEGHKKAGMRYYKFEDERKKMKEELLQGFDAAHGYANRLLTVIGKDENLASKVASLTECIMLGYLLEGGLGKAAELFRQAMK